VPTSTQFKGVNSSAQQLLSGQLAANLKLFLDWACLEAGAYATVTLPASPTTTAGPHRLRPSDDPDYLPGRVWEGYRKDWVWETGVAWAPAPIDVSGVWVNGSFKPLDSVGPYAHVVDYPNGRVVFATPVPTGSHVAAEYSWRKYQVYTDEPDWFREVQLESDWASPQFLQQASGAWSAMADARVQTAAVVVRPLAGVSHSPKEIGSLAQHKTQSVTLDVLGDNPKDVAWMHDVLVDQKEHRLWLFDLNAVIRADKWPLDGNGGRKTGAKMYPALVAGTGAGGYVWRLCEVSDTASQERPNRPPLRHATVLWRVQVDIP
jgi:hypothetical protein